MSALEGTQQHLLHVGRQVDHLVEEQRAAPGFFKIAQPAGIRPRERAPLVPEQGGGGQLLRQQPAVHRHERLARPPAPCVYLLGDVLLARAALARYQHAHVGGRHQPYPPVYLAEGGALPLVDGRVGAVRPFPQGFQEREEVVRQQFLRDVVLRAQLHRAHGGRHLAIVGHDNVGVLPPLFPQLFQQGDAVAEGKQGRQAYPLRSLLRDAPFGDGNQLVDGERLGEQGGKAGCHHVLFLHIPGSGGYHHGDGPRVADVRRAQQFQDPVTVYVRHLQVGYQQVVIFRAYGFYQFADIRANITIHAARSEHVTHHTQREAVIVYHQYGTSCHAERLSARHSVPDFLGFGQRQGDGKPAAMARLALHFDVASHQLQGVGDNGKPQTEAVLRGGIAKPFKGHEYPFLLFPFYACSCIFHREGENAARITGNKRDLPAVQPEILQQAVYHPRHAPGGRHDRFGMADAVAGCLVFQQQLRIPADGGQGRAQLVGNGLYEVAPQADQLPVLLVGSFQLAYQPLALPLFVGVAFQLAVDGEVGEEQRMMAAERVAVSRRFSRMFSARLRERRLSA